MSEKLHLVLCVLTSLRVAAVQMCFMVCRYTTSGSSHYIGGVLPEIAVVRASQSFEICVLDNLKRSEISCFDTMDYATEHIGLLESLVKRKS